MSSYVGKKRQCILKSPSNQRSWWEPVSILQIEKKTLTRYRTLQALLHQHVKVILVRRSFLARSRQPWKSEEMPSFGNFLTQCVTSVLCLPRQRFVRAPPYAYPVRVGAWRKLDFSNTATLTLKFMVKRRDPRPTESAAIGQRTQEGLRPAFACQSGLAPELGRLDKPVERHSTFLLCCSPPGRHQLQLLVRADNSIIEMKTCFFLQCHKRATRSSMALSVHFSPINSSEESSSDTSFPAFAYYAETSSMCTASRATRSTDAPKISYPLFCIAANLKPTCAAYWSPARKDRRQHTSPLAERT